MKNVKSIVLALFIGAFVGHVESANAQVVSTKEQKEIIKNRKELAKQTRKQVGQCMEGCQKSGKTVEERRLETLPRQSYLRNTAKRHDDAPL